MVAASAATERSGRGRSPEPPAWGDEGAGEAAPVRFDDGGAGAGAVARPPGAVLSARSPGMAVAEAQRGGADRRLPGTVPSLPRRSPRGSASSPVVRALFGPRGNGGVGRRWRERRRRRRPSAPERRRRRPAAAPFPPSARERRRRRSENGTAQARSRAAHGGARPKPHRAPRPLRGRLRQTEWHRVTCAGRERRPSARSVRRAFSRRLGQRPMPDDPAHDPVFLGSRPRRVLGLLLTSSRPSSRLPVPSPSTPERRGRCACRVRLPRPTSSAPERRRGSPLPHPEFSGRPGERLDSLGSASKCATRRSSPRPRRTRRERQRRRETGGGEPRAAACR